MGGYRRLLAGVLCVVCLGTAGAAVAPVALAAEGASSSLVLSGDPLVLEGTLTEAEQLRTAEEAHLASPEAVLAREESEFAYSGLGASESEALALRVFPSVVNEAGGGLPRLPSGERATGFPTDFSATLELPEGKQGVLASGAPVAVEDASGQRMPIDLTPREAGSGFEAARPLTGVHARIGARLNEGGSLSDVGVSLAPVTASGGALEGTRAVMGASVFYADSENRPAGVSDVDSLLKFDTYGFSEETILRSQNAPQVLYFRVGLPEGASLAQSADGSGLVQVVDGGRVVAQIGGLSAHDAEGTRVPVSLSLSGDTLAVMVEHRPGQYRLPIEVDPTTYDTQVLAIHNGLTYQSRWKVNTSNGKEGPFYFSEGFSFGIRDLHPENSTPGYNAGEWGGYGYTTQGESSIYDVHVTSALSDNGVGFEAQARLTNKGKTGKNEAFASHLDSYSEGSWPGWALCMLAGCAVPSEVTKEIEENSYTLVQNATRTGNYYMDAELWNAWVYIVQTKNSVVSFDTADKEISGIPNALYGSEHWVKGPAGVVKGIAKDPGIGISELEFTSPNESKWGISEPFMQPATALCQGVICPQEETRLVNLSGLPDGKDTVTFAGQNATDTKELAAKVSAAVYIDNTAPHNIVLSGLPASKEIGGGEYKLTAEAMDGTEPTPSSGMKSMTLLIDGKEAGLLSTPCSPGPCLVHSGTWTIFGHNYAAGRHTVTVQATDNAGNTSSESFVMIVHPASPVSVGPGVVNPLSGELTLTAIDVSMGGGLTVGRSYGSEHLSAGESGPLSSQWGLSLGGEETLIKQLDGSMVLTDVSGAQTIFAPDGKGGYISPAGDSNLTLSNSPCEAGQSEFMLKNAAAATTTCFRVPAGGTSEVWTPSITKGAVATDTVTYAYQTVEVAGRKITRPTEALAPVPAGVSCSPELRPGCRALTFNYAESTTAKGEAQIEWGDYNGHLTRVYDTAYDPVSKAMKTVEVAHYLYDSHARLRAEWDPRIKPELKTIYGYDAEGHLTSLTAPGQETWAFTYGTTASDATSGRMLKARQAPASSTLWTGEELKGTEAPRLSGAPVTGKRMASTDGVWSGNPVAYAYQWEDCNPAGAECKPVLEADNPNYTPGSGDIGHTLIAQVTATNGSGSVIASSAASAVISSGAPTIPIYISQFGSFGSGNGQFNTPWDIASGSSGNVYVADRNNNRVEEFTGEGVFVRVWGSEGTGNGQFKHPEGIAVDSKGNVWVTDHNNDRVEEFTSEGSFIRVFGSLGAGNGQLNLPEGLEVDSKGNVWVADDGNNRIEEFTGEGAFVRVVGSGGTGNGQLKSPADVTIDSQGNVWVADTGNDRLQEFTSEGAFLSAVGSSGNGNGQFNTPWRLASGPESTLWVSDSNNNRVQVLSTKGEYEYQFGTGGTGAGQFSAPTGVAFHGPNVYVLDRGNNRVERWVTPPRYISQFGSVGSGNGQLSTPWDIASGSSGNVYVADRNNNRVEEFTAEGVFVKVWGSEGTGNGQFKHPEGITVDSKGNVWVTDHNNDRVEEFTSEGAFIRAFGSLGAGNGQLNLPEGLEVDSKGNVWVADDGNNRVEEFTGEGAFLRVIGTAGTGNGQFKAPSDVAIDSQGNVWVADSGNNRLQEFTSEGSFIGAYGSSGAGNGQFNTPWRLASGPESTLWVSDSNNNRVQVLSTKGEYEYQFGVLGEYEAQFKAPTGVAFYGSSVFVLDRGNNRVSVWTREMNGVYAQGSQRSPQPGATVEYGVPLSGSGLPNLTKAEVEKWAQKDLPAEAEATAVFPPDEPQGWPATSYKRANIYYRDGTSRNVNVATPGGGVSTSEYNEHNDVVRSLSADNRALALKDAKPAEAAKLLDTQSEYNTEGTELLSTLGPRHTVKLANGKEAQARNHTVYSYDEGAPSEGGPYRLVTKTAQGAQIEGEPEQDIRTTITQYSGQNGLGWTLRKQTAITTDPNGLKLTRRTVYDPGTGNVLETRAPGAPGPLPHLRYLSSWGSFGVPAVNRAEGVAVDKEGHLWFADTENSRIVELSSSGGLLRTAGSLGSGNGQFNKPAGLATDASGNVWVADTANNRVQELSSTGVYIRQAGSVGTGNGQFKSPRGLTVDPTGHIWVADTGNNRVQELTSEGAYMTQYGSNGVGNGQLKGPFSVVVDKEADVWIADTGNGRIQELSSSGVYVRQFGKEGNVKPCKEELGEITCPFGWPYAIALDSAGHIWAAAGSKVEKFSTTGEMLAHFGTAGHGEAQFEELRSIALEAESHLWVADTGNSRVQELTIAGAYVRQYPAPNAPATLNSPKSITQSSAGNLLVADTGNRRVQEVSVTGGFIKQGFWQAKQPEGITVDAQGSIWFSNTAESVLARASAAIVGEFAVHVFTGSESFNEPAGVAASGEKVYTVDRANNRIVELEKSVYARQFGTLGSGNGQLSKPQGAATDSKGDVWVADTGNNRIEEFSPEGAYITQHGTLGTGNGQFSKPQGVTIDNEGNIWVADTGNNRVQVLSPIGTYIQQFGSAGTGEGQMKEPTGITTDASHHVYVLDTGNNRVQTWLNEGETEYAPTPHSTQIIYYTTAANTTYPSCGNHPEWALLPCQTQPSAQPNTTGIPNLPVTTTTYNMYEEPLSTTSTVATSTRTTTITYDEAGRPLSSETTSNVGETLPKVNDKYSETTGALVEQNTSTEALKGTFNAVGQLTSYTDADGNTTTYEYENGSDTRLTHLNDGKGTQTYTYDTTTGLVKELTDSAAGTLTAAYDLEGNLTSESYPNAMSANYTLNPVGQPTAIQYVKNKTCAKTCPETWYSDTMVPSIHGQWMSQQSNQAAQAYTYDQAGRLTQAQYTPAGQGCITRIYAYDEETNRTSVTTRQPGTGGVCANEGGTVGNHTYDTANRLLDTGVTYDSFGNMTKLPAGDAGGYELTSSFYENNRLQNQTQNGQTIGYQLDPASRTREIVSSGKIIATEIQHYATPSSNTPSWTGEVSANYTRYITGISGTLTAIQHNGEQPVLQLANLHGDIVATASNTETATTLASTVAEASEYGVPATEAPPKYSWLGAHQLPTTLPSGAIAMGIRSYIPQLGRYLQPDPIPAGSANAYAYVYGDPMSTSDLTGEYTWGFASYLTESLDAHGAELAQAYEAEVRAEAERLAAQAAAEAQAYAALETEGPEEEWEWEEEESGTENAAFGPGPTNQHHEARTEGGTFQRQSGEAEGSFDLSPCTVGSEEMVCTRRAMGAAGVGYWWGRKQVRWCVHHPWAYYHNQKTYSMCQQAAKVADPGSDECHMWGSLIALVGLPETNVPVLVARAVKAMGLGMLITC